MAKIKVTLVQDATNRVVAVRVGEAEIAVMHAGPAVGAGTMNLALVIENVDIAYAQVDAPKAVPAE
ncbi:hypothetical protein [Methylobacterium sp. WSM2598]|uniref:hypothetical protein n=1 Tax=Methylobacterium sp. WSM2598 TaxID=398261 RepID=UPI00036CD444|nr:hypothetical protein [Methylobacterium sp. WSM2598]